MLPVANENAAPILGLVNPNGPEVRRRIGKEQFIAHFAKRPACSFENDAANIALAEVREEQVVAKLRRQRVVRVGGRAGRRARAGIGAVVLLWRASAPARQVLVASPTLTPGVVNPEVRQETIGETI